METLEAKRRVMELYARKQQRLDQIAPPHKHKHAPITRVEDSRPKTAAPLSSSTKITKRRSQKRRPGSAISINPSIVVQQAITNEQKLGNATTQHFQPAPNAEEATVSTEQAMEVVADSPPRQTDTQRIDGYKFLNTDLDTMIVSQNANAYVEKYRTPEKYDL